MNYKKKIISKIIAIMLCLTIALSGRSTVLAAEGELILPEDVKGTDVQNLSEQPEVKEGKQDSSEDEGEQDSPEDEGKQDSSEDEGEQGSSEDEGKQESLEDEEDKKEPEEDKEDIPAPVKKGWVKEDNGWYYYDNKGEKATGWHRINGVWYYMHEDGLMAENTWIGEYYVDKSGAWIEKYRPAKWIKSGSKWWYRDIDGSYPANEWKLIDKEWYYFDKSGWMRTGWEKIDGTWYYLKSSGAMATNWQKIGGTWYYLKSSGAMATDWQKIDETWYYLKSSGAMATGWQKIGGTWYYLKSDGAMVTGKHIIGKTTYLLYDSGAMATGWVKEDDGWYYYQLSGAMQKGWLFLKNKWYYCDKISGLMYEEEWLDNNYYLKKDGVMATGWLELNGKWYYFNESGMKQKSKWIGNYYVHPDGTMAVSEWITTGSGKWYVGDDGKWIPLEDNESVYKIELKDGKTTTVIGYYDSKLSNEILGKMNDYRDSKGLRGLQPATGQMMEAVRERVVEIAYKNSHIRPNGEDFTSIYEGVFAENRSTNFASSNDVLQVWKNSVDHKENMLSKEAKTAGVAVFKLRSNNTYINYCVMMFAK